MEQVRTKIVNQTDQNGEDGNNDDTVQEAF